jgi:hypothetical protein
MAAGKREEERGMLLAQARIKSLKKVPQKSQISRFLATGEFGRRTIEPIHPLAAAKIAEYERTGKLTF